MNSTAPVKSANTETALQSLATLYKAGGDPLRLDILRVLQRDTFGVMELCRLFNMRQSGMSHHLKVLTQAGLLEPQREGNATFYRRPLLRTGDEPRYTAVRSIFEAVDQIQLTEELLERIRTIRRQRSEQSQVFFARYARHFREQQELIAAFDTYAEPTAELIRARAARHQWRTALEIGPGEGAFLLVIADICQHVVAVDNSADMLRKDLCDLIVSPHAPEATDIMQRGLMADHMVVFYDPAHRQAPESLADYLKADHIGILFGTGEKTALEDALAARGLNRRTAVTVANFSGLPAFLRGTDMLATAPGKMRDQLLKGFSSTPLPFDYKPFTLLMLWHKRHQSDPAHRWIRNQLNSVAAGLNR